MASIGDVFLRLLADGTGFQADIERKAGPAADKAGQTLGKRLSSGIKANLGRAIAGGLGTALGAGFAIATQQGAELDAKAQQLIADTGLVGGAADQAKGQLAGLYRDNLQGFGEIGDALGKVYTDLGLTGDAAKTAAQAALSYATATKQDAGTVVGAFDDILDSYNMAATDAPRVMDMLVASHQKYGGNIAENQDALKKLAPAMNAAGFSIEDSVGLLDLFNAAGVDASKIPQAMNTALKKVKSPKELKQLIADIANTKDPFKRAEKAIDLFGTRAGPQLAQALSQGNLDDFIVTMDEARGATDKAADAVKSGWGNQFQLILKNAGGYLAEFGQNFGPLLMVGAQIGPKLGTAIATAIGGLASFLPAGIQAALGKLGAKLGIGVATTMGAEIAGEAGAKAIAGGVTAAGSNAAVTAGATSLGAALGVAIGIAMAAALTIALAQWINNNAKPALPGVTEHFGAAGSGGGGRGSAAANALANAKANATRAADTLGGSSSGIRASGGPVIAGRPYIVGERGTELFVPQVAGTVIPNSQLGAAMGASTTNITVPVTGLIRARSPLEIANQIRRVGDFLTLTTRREPA